MKSKMRIFFCFLSIYFLVGPVMAGLEEKDRTRFSVPLSSGRELILTLVGLGGAVDQRFEDKLTIAVPLIFNQFIKVFGPTYKAQNTLKVRIFFDTDEFLDYKKKRAVDRTAIGFYETGNNVINVVYRSSADMTLPTIYHELSHYFLDKFGASLPGTTGEDFVDIIGLYQIPELGIRWRGSSFYGTLRDKILKREPPDLMMSLGSKGDHSSYCSQDEQISFLVITYLLSGSGRADVLGQTLRFMSHRGWTPDSFVEGLDCYYEGGIRRLQDDWGKWVVDYIDRIRNS